MKTLTAILASLWILTIGAAAQEKLWTWTIDPGYAYQIMHASAMAKDGSAAFVLGLIAIDDGSPGKPPPSEYQLVWINAKGKVLLSRRFATDDSLLTIFSAQGGWEVGIFDKNTLAVANNDKVRIYKLVDGKVSGPKILEHPRALMFGGNGFQGWLARLATTGVTEFTNGILGQAVIKYESIVSLTAWKL